MERIFHLKENGTSVKTEILAGLFQMKDTLHVIFSFVKCCASSAQVSS